MTGISDVTGFPECLDGSSEDFAPCSTRRYPGKKRCAGAYAAAERYLNIETIDIVAINLYPFKETIMKPDVTLADAIENIDGSGQLPCSVRQQRTTRTLQ